MLRSLWSGVSGLNANQIAMDVIGNNIANVNTIGFKMGRAVFQDMMSQTLSGAKAPTDLRGGTDPRQIGSGAALASIDNIFQEGIIKPTQRKHDLAISGNGMFVVNGGAGNVYTRAGDFNFDKSGTYVNPAGYKVQGYMFDPVTGEEIETGVLTDIVLGPEYKVMLSKESTEINLSGVLDTRATASTIEYPMFMTQAMANQNITDLSDKSGVSLNVKVGDKIITKAHASMQTNMGDLITKDGGNVVITNGQSITFDFGVDGRYSLKYDSAGAPSTVGDNIFTSVDDFIAESNFMFRRIAAQKAVPSTTAYETVVPIATMTLVDGQFKLTGNGPFVLDGITGAPHFQELLRDLDGIYQNNTVKRTTDEVFFQKEVTVGVDFDLTDLSAEITDAINSGIVGNGFEAEYMENNFGMNSGEKILVGAEIKVERALTTGQTITTTDPIILTAGFTLQDNITLGGDMNIGTSVLVSTTASFTFTGGNIILGGDLQTSGTLMNLGVNGMIVGENMLIPTGAAINLNNTIMELAGNMTIPTGVTTFNPFMNGTTSATTTGTIKIGADFPVPLDLKIVAGGTTYTAGATIPAGTVLPTGTIITNTAIGTINSFILPAGSVLGTGFSITNDPEPTMTIPSGTMILFGATIQGLNLTKGTTITGGTNTNLEFTAVNTAFPPNTIFTEGITFDTDHISSGTPLLPNTLPEGITIPEGTTMTSGENRTISSWKKIQVPLTYTNNINPDPGSGLFNTTEELARELANRLSNLNPNALPNSTEYTPGFDTGDILAGHSTINYAMVGNSFSLIHNGGTPIRLAESEMVSIIGGTEPNSFLKSVLDAAFTERTSSGNTIVPVELGNGIDAILAGPIDGKGRISYSFEPTPENTLINLGVTTGATSGLGMKNGEQLHFNVGSAVITVTYSDVAGGGTTFSSSAELETAINNALRDTGGVYAQLSFSLDRISNPPTFEFSTATGFPYTFGRVTSTSATPYLADMFNAGLAGQTVTSGAPVISNAFLSKVSNISGLEFDKTGDSSVFVDNMLQSSINTISLGSATTSDLFLIAAVETTRISDLFTGQGEYLGFSENNKNIEFDGAVGGEEVTTDPFFNVQTDTTIDDLMDAMEEYLGLAGTRDKFDNVSIKNGIITVVGEKGAGNNIDNFGMTVQDSNNSAVFDNYITQVKQTKASGGFSATNMTIYDEQGNRHVIKFSFSILNEESNEWTLNIETDEQFAKVSFNDASTNEVVLKFNPDGTLARIYDNFTIPPTNLPTPPTLNFTAPNGASSITGIDLNIGGDGKTSGMVIQGSPNAFTETWTDGYPLGNLEDTFFNPAGELIGTYTNNQVRVLAQVGLATFENNQGLLKVGDSLFQETGNSGQPVIGKPLTASKGEIRSSNLEQSNVNLSEEFTNMIVTQRAFQANSRIITTSDEMIQELLNMKR